MPQTADPMTDYTTDYTAQLAVDAAPACGVRIYQTGREISPIGNVLACENPKLSPIPGAFKWLAWPQVQLDYAAETHYRTTTPARQRRPRGSTHQPSTEPSSTNPDAPTSSARGRCLSK